MKRCLNQRRRGGSDGGGVIGVDTGSSSVVLAPRTAGSPRASSGISSGSAWGTSSTSVVGGAAGSGEATGSVGVGSALTTGRGSSFTTSSVLPSSVSGASVSSHSQRLPFSLRYTTSSATDFESLYLISWRTLPSGARSSILPFWLGRVKRENSRVSFLSEWGGMTKLSRMG